ncbi:MAG: TolC family protein [Chlorobi bacterium]|nr:TolC family protein [Chlorobiota bacterium]
MNIKQTYRSRVRLGQRIYLLILLTLWPAMGQLMAQPLDSLYVIGLRNHPGVEAMELAIEQTKARASAAGAWSVPGAGVEFRMLPPLNPNPFSTGETMLVVEQEIPLFGQNKKKAEAEQSMARVEEAKIELHYRRFYTWIADEYYSIWQIEEERKLNRLSRELAEKLYEDVEIRYKVDNARPSELYSIAVEIERLNAEFNTLASQYGESSRRLNALLGRPLDDSVIIVDKPESTPLPPFEELVALLKNHPQLRRLEAIAQAQQKKADAVESGLNPTLTLRSGLSWMPDGHPVRMENLGLTLGEINREGMLNRDNFGLMAGAMISIPIVPWARSGIEGKASEARLMARGALAERNSVLRDLIAALGKPYGTIERATIMIDFYREKQIPLLEEQIELLRSDYINDRALFSDLIDVYRMLVMTGKDMVMKEGERARAQAKIREMTMESSQ